MHAALPLPMGQDKWLFFYFISPSLYYQLGHFSIFIAFAQYEKSLLHEFRDFTRTLFVVLKELASVLRDSFVLRLRSLHHTFLTPRSKLFPLLLRLKIKTSENYLGLCYSPFLSRPPLSVYNSIWLQFFTSPFIIPPSAQLKLAFFSAIIVLFARSLRLQFTIV